MFEPTSRNDASASMGASLVCRNWFISRIEGNFSVCCEGEVKNIAGPTYGGKRDGPLTSCAPSFSYHRQTAIMKNVGQVVSVGMLCIGLHLADYHTVNKSTCFRSQVRSGRGQGNQYRLVVSRHHFWRKLRSNAIL